MLFDARMAKSQVTGTGRTINEWIAGLDSEAQIVVSRSTSLDSKLPNRVLSYRANSPQEIAFEGVIRRFHSDLTIQPWMFGPIGHKDTVLGIYDLIPLGFGSIKSALLIRRLRQVRRNQGIRVVTLAKVTAARLVMEFEIPEERVFICRPGVPTVNPISDYNPPSNNAGHILAISRISPHKNLETLVAAWRPKIHPDLVIVLPSADYDNPLVQAWRQRGVQIKCNLPEQELMDLYRNASVVACPSQEEGYGLPLAEAANFGCPIIASSIGAFTEMPISGITWVEPTSVQLWSSALSRIEALPRTHWSEVPPTWDGFRHDLAKVLA